MRAIFILALLLSTIPANASDRLCSVAQAAWENPYYVARVSHEEIARPLTYTASPPATLIAQHYITATITLTVPQSMPPITYTIQTFDYSETTSLVGYTPLTPRPHDYAYTFRSSAPFSTWACTEGVQAHTFLSIVNR